jgi:hypothetical protein
MSVMRASGFAVTFAATAAALSTVGADSATAPPTSDPVREAAFAYAQCLRDNGIEDYPDPEITPRTMLSFGSSVRCGLRPYAEPLDSVGALANGRRRRAPTAESGRRPVTDLGGRGIRKSAVSRPDPGMMRGPPSLAGSCRSDGDALQA